MIWDINHIGGPNTSHLVFACHRTCRTSDGRSSRRGFKDGEDEDDNEDEEKGQGVGVR